MNRKRYLGEAFKKINLEVNDLQLEQFETYYQLLIEKNRVINLTAITDFEDVVLKHFVDSLSISMFFVPEKGMKGIDLGSGAGFPGIPVKIAYPDCRITLMDSLNKRTGFQNEVIEELKLDGIEAVHSRAEDAAAEEEYREKYDFCLSRAVADLCVLSEYCLPFVRVGGIFVAYKSENTDEEIKNSARAVEILGGKIEEVRDFYLAESDIARRLIFIRKEEHTPGKYPRRAGIPVKNPLH